MEITGENCIAGDWSKQGKETFRTFSSRLGTENRELFYEATQDEIDRALDAAQRAFIDYAQLGDDKRAEFLATIKNLLLANKDYLLAQYCLESSLSAERSQVEFERIIFQLQSFIEFIQDGEFRIPHTHFDNQALQKRLIPIGPIAVFGASNFPFAYSTIGGDTVAALAAGCPVIVKSHPMHAGVGEMVSRIISEALTQQDLPQGIFSNVNSNSKFAGEYLVQHPNIKGVGFTGSYQVGMHLFRLGANRPDPIPVFSEMGSTNPVILLPEVLSERYEEIAQKLTASLTDSCGQYCTNPGIIVGIKSKGWDEFKKELYDCTLSVDEQAMLHPNISGNFTNRLNSLEQEMGFSYFLNNNNENTSKYHTLPVLGIMSARYFMASENAHEEVFGPFSMLVECDDQIELEQVVQSFSGQLTSTIWFDENDEGLKARLEFDLVQRCGRIIYNGVPTGVKVSEEMTHGGPFPACTDARFTAVGTDSILRFLRPITVQQ